MPHENIAAILFVELEFSFPNLIFITKVDLNFADFISTRVRCNRLIQDEVICPDASITEISIRIIIGDTEDTIEEETGSDQEEGDFQSFTKKHRTINILVTI